MYINKEISHLDGLTIIKSKYRAEYDELLKYISTFNFAEIPIADSTESSGTPKQKGLSGVLGTAGTVGVAAGGLGHFAGIGAVGAVTGLKGAAAMAAASVFLGPFAIGIPAIIASGAVIASQLKPEKGSYKSKDIDLDKILDKNGWTEYLDAGEQLQTRVSYVKNRLGLELVKPGLNDLAMSLFFNIQSSARRGEVDAAVILLQVPGETKNEQQYYIQQMIELFEVLSPIPLQVPFVILCISNHKGQSNPVSLTQEIDTIILNRTGMYFSDIVRLHERSNWEFKLKLYKADDSKKEKSEAKSKLCKECCSFANHHEGGIIVYGVSDDGKRVGIPNEEIDQLERTIRSIIRSSIDPQITPDIKTFEAETNGHSLLVIDVSPAPQKPVTYSGRVYVRSGTSSEPATGDEIRTMVIADSLG